MQRDAQIDHGIDIVPIQTYGLAVGFDGIIAPIGRLKNIAATPMVSGFPGIDGYGPVHAGKRCIEMGEFFQHQAMDVVNIRPVGQKTGQTGVKAGSGLPVAMG
jgi:hypothetical protein